MCCDCACVVEERYIWSINSVLARNVAGETFFTVHMIKIQRSNPQIIIYIYIKSFFTIKKNFSIIYLYRLLCWYIYKTVTYRNEL